MGTSKGYQAPSSPQWGKFKGKVTAASGGGAVTPDIAREIIRGFIQTNGGVENIVQGKGTIGSSRVAQTVAGRFAGFVSSVSTTGLPETLDQYGLGDLIGKPSGEISSALLDFLCDDGSILDEVDARSAMADLIDELLTGIRELEQIQQILEERLQSDTLESLLAQFFGHYIYHQFCRVFFERITTRHGEEKSKSFMESIKWFIDEELKYISSNKKLMDIDWKGHEGQALIDEILQETLVMLGG